MYVSDIHDLYRTTGSHLKSFGRCEYLSSEEQYVQFVCYDALLFTIAMPQHPYSSFTISHLIGPNHSTTQTLLGHDLTFIGNSEEALHRAFEIVQYFCQLRLPQKYIDAWELTRVQNP